MYQSPDFIKVELDVKDNFANYGSCYRNSWVVLTNNEVVAPTGVCSVDQVTTYGTGENDYQCFINSMSY